MQFILCWIVAFAVAFGLQYLMEGEVLSVINIYGAAFSGALIQKVANF